MTMKTPVALVTAALTAAILLAATFLIATGTRGEGAQPDNLAQTELTSPTSK
jgi:aldose sugar dehydrogenase